jgi:hypothetical protein
MRTVFAAIVVVTIGCASKDDAHETEILDADAFDLGPADLGDVFGLDENGCMPGMYFHALDVEPSTSIAQIDTATTPPTPAKVIYTAKVSCEGPGVDVTTEAHFALEDAPLGTFEGNALTSSSSIPDIVGPGATTTLVHATARGFTGLAALTIVQYRATGEHRDLFFQIPYLVAASPTHQPLVANVTTIDDVTVKIASDPHNPASPDGKRYDATTFLSAVRAMDEGSAKDGCTANAAKDTDGDGVLDTFVGPIDGSICFEAAPTVNHTIATKALATTLVADVLIVATPSGTALDVRNIVLMVPGTNLRP